MPTWLKGFSRDSRYSALVVMGLYLQELILPTFIRNFNWKIGQHEQNWPRSFYVVANSCKVPALITAVARTESCKFIGDIETVLCYSNEACLVRR